jgi:hypothetical protein
MEPNREERGISAMRPKSLTFLCYLTIFASLYMILSSFGGIFNTDQQVKMTEELISEYDALITANSRDSKGIEEFQKILKEISLANNASNTHDYSVFTLIFNSLTLIGAFLMLRLKKNGFRLYTLGNLIAVVSSILVFGENNWLGIAFASYHGVTGIIFTTLYIPKMKYMD